MSICALSIDSPRHQLVMRGTPTANWMQSGGVMVFTPPPPVQWLTGLTSDAVQTVESVF